MRNNRSVASEETSPLLLHKVNTLPLRKATTAEGVPHKMPDVNGVKVGPIATTAREDVAYRFPLPLS
jgi:hypothetical protein